MYMQIYLEWKNAKIFYYIFCMYKSLVVTPMVQDLENAFICKYIQQHPFSYFIVGYFSIHGYSYVHYTYK